MLRRRQEDTASQFRDCKCATGHATAAPRCRNTAQASDDLLQQAMAAIGLTHLR